MHFLEYGAVAWLFYRAWLPIGDASVLILAFLSAMTVGTFEEWFEWYIPARVGELRDVLLNSVAIGCGLLVSVAIQPLPARDRHGRPGARRGPALAVVLAIATLALGGFTDMAACRPRDTRPEHRDVSIDLYRRRARRPPRTERATTWAAQPPMTRSGTAIA